MPSIIHNTVNTAHGKQAKAIMIYKKSMVLSFQIGC